MNKPVFIISLDLELAWGFILKPEHWVLKLLAGDPHRGRGAIATLVNLFERHAIPATWATVGHLMLSPGESKAWIYREMPQFQQGWLDWGFYTSVRNSPLYCAPDIIEDILASPARHEIGLHSFFHLPFSHCDEAVANEEMRLGVALAQRRGIAMKSLVFPGNYLGHTDILADYGIEIFRGNDPEYRQDSLNPLARRAAGAADILVASPVEPVWREGVWEIPGSKYFCGPRLPFTLLPRARVGLERAIRTNKVFHIWLHPWNLLQQADLAADLDKFLALVAKKRDRGELEVMTMSGLAASLNRKKAGCHAGR